MWNLKNSGERASGVRNHTRATVLWSFCRLSFRRKLWRLSGSLQAMAGNIFINYRREGSGHVAGRLHNSLPRRSAAISSSWMSTTSQLGETSRST